MLNKILLLTCYSFASRLHEQRLSGDELHVAHAHKAFAGINLPVLMWKEKLTITRIVSCSYMTRPCFVKIFCIIYASNYSVFVVEHFCTKIWRCKRSFNITGTSCKKAVMSVISAMMMSDLSQSSNKSDIVTLQAKLGYLYAKLKTQG